MKIDLAVLFSLLLLPGVPQLAAQEPAIVEEELTDEGPAPAGLEEHEREAERLFARGDFAGAGAAYRRLAERHADPAEKARVLVLAAWSEHLQERDAEAFRALKQTLVLEPGFEFRTELYSESFRALFLEAQKQALVERDLKAYEAVRRGLERLKAREYGAARGAFEEALSYRADHPQGLFNLALASLHEGRYDEALAGFERVVALAAARPEEISDEMRGLALTNVGYLYNRRQLSEEAEKVLEEAVELYPDNASAWSNLGVSRRRLGKKVPAAEAFRRAHELDPDDEVVMHNLGLAYIDAEDWISAVAVLKPATERFGGNARLWLDLGLAQTGLGNTAGAVESFETAIANDPDNARGVAHDAALRLASHYLAAADYEATLAAARRILGWRRHASPGWVYQGLAQRALGDLEAARQSLEQARGLDPVRADVHNNLGSVYFELRLLDQAEEAFKRALELDPALAEVRENLAAVQAVRSWPSAPAAPPGVAPPGAAPPSPPPPSPPPPSPPARPPLGLRFADIDYSALGLRGVMVEAVVPGTLASRADLKAKDLILKVDGRDVTSPEDLERYVRETGKESVVLDLLRDSLPRRVEMRLD